MSRAPKHAEEGEQSSAESAAFYRLEQVDYHVYMLSELVLASTSYSPEFEHHILAALDEVKRMKERCETRYAAFRRSTLRDDE